MRQRTRGFRFLPAAAAAVLIASALAAGCLPRTPAGGRPTGQPTAPSTPGAGNGGTDSNGPATPVGAAGAPDNPARPATDMRFDVIIAGGSVIDGTGRPRHRADVGITGDTISFVGNLAGHTAPRRIDATGLVVAPGFINPHSHTWDTLANYPTDPATAASLRQGITTEIGGVDGRSAWPIGAYLEQIQRQGTGVNFGTFAGQGTIREQVMGRQQGPANALQRSQMQDLVRQAMMDGAFGLSTGLEYTPGSYADTDEIIALAQVAAAAGGVYSTHLRSESDHLLTALDEALRIGSEAGMPVNLSHLKVVFPWNWDQAPALFHRVEQALAAGQQVFGDVYPYLAPDYATNKRLAEVAGTYAPELLVVKRTADPALLGITVAEIAARWQVDAAAATARLLAADPNTLVAALVTSPAALLQLLAADWTVVSSDGESGPFYADPDVALARVHPRNYGTYPRVLRWVREGRVDLTLEAAVRKMSSAVADRLGIARRGYVQSGYLADLVVFDPATVADRAEWHDPQQFPDGVEYVLVNGQVAVSAGELQAGVRAGRIVRPE